MKLRYFSHSAFQITTDNGTKILIDPFFDGNPTSPIKSEEADAEYIILTHGHADHFGDTEKIGKRNNSLVIAVLELANYCEKKGLRSHGMQIGGAFNFDFGRVKFTLAFHGSSTIEGYYAGLAGGVILNIDGKTIYHAGDTALFYDMKLIGELNSIDYMLVPVGDNYTMGIDDAVKAVEFVKPKVTVPIHYNTWSVINADVNKFKNDLQKSGFECKIMNYNEEINI